MPTPNLASSFCRPTTSIAVREVAPAVSSATFFSLAISSVVSPATAPTSAIAFSSAIALLADFINSSFKRAIPAAIPAEANRYLPNTVILLARPRNAPPLLLDAITLFP